MGMGWNWIAGLHRRRIARLAVLPVLLSGALLACGSDTGHPKHLTIDTLPGGRVVVRNPMHGLWDSASAWRVEERWRVGRLEGNGPELFGDISAIAVDGFDRTYVIERHDQQIRVFDRDGRYVRTFGRKGQGPGEFLDALGLAFASDARLWVVDPQFGRVSVFDTAGTFLTSYRTPGGHSVMPWPGGFSRDGSFYDVARDPGGGWGSVLVRYDTAFTPLDTLRPPRWENADAVLEVVSADGRARSRGIVPFSASSMWALTPQGDFWTVQTGDYELDRVSPRGDTLRTVTRPYDPVPVTQADRDRAIKSMAWVTRQWGTVDPDRIPSVKPAVRSLYVAEDGDLWVGRVTDTPEVVFDVFDPDGRLLGQVQLPFQPSLPPVIRGELMVAVTRGEMGVPFVVCAKIVKP
jgi:hypothetical protein